MKAEELRIGNWVRHYSEWSYRMPDNGPFEEFDFQWEERDWYGTAESCLELDKIKPIPLTEQWLKKLGFELITDHDYPGWYSTPILGERVRIFEVENGWYKYHSAHIVMQHVHQLMNLYHALTGQELTSATPQR